MKQSEFPEHGLLPCYGDMQNYSLLNWATIMSIIIFRSHNSVCLKITNYISEVLKVIDIGDSIILRTIIIQKNGFDMFDKQI